MTRQTLSSLFPLRTRDCPNSVDWGRPPLLVYCRIWRCEAPPELPFFPRRHSHYDCNLFLYGSRILLLSDMDAEQTVAVVMLYHRYRLYTDHSESGILAPDIFYEYSSWLLNQLGQCGGQSQSVPCTLIRKASYLTRR